MELIELKNNEESLLEAHHALWSKMLQDSGVERMVIAGKSCRIRKYDSPGRRYAVADIDDDLFMATQNLAKSSKNTAEVKGSNYQTLISWIIHKDRGYVAKIVSMQMDDRVEWL